MKKLLLFICLLPFFGFAQNVTLIPTGSSWKYLANGSNQGTTWRSLTFNDASWPSGNAELGYGDGGEATVVSYGPSSSNKYRTTYFRKSFTVTSPAAYTSLTLRLLRDDGAVVYLNGTQIARSNMTSGTITYTTLSTSNISGSGETTYYNYTALSSLLVAGNNVIAVEIHQSSPASPDISFNLKLEATPAPVTCGTSTSLTTINTTTTTATVGWAAVSGATSYNVRYRISGSGSWINQSTAATQLQLTGLTASTLYDYEIQTVCASGPGSWSATATFTTAVICGTPTSLTTINTTTTTATVGWAAVSGATSYNVRYRISGSGSWINQSTAATQLQLTGLTASTLYDYEIQAVCASGPGSWSVTATFTTQAAVTCGIPTALTTINRTSSTATVGWGAVSGATSYNVRYSISGAASWINQSTSATQIQLTGLTAGTLYDYAIQAVCASGPGSWSAISTFSTLGSGTDSLITTNSTWRYLDNGTNQGTAWRAAGFNDGGWFSGTAELGYGDGDESTVVSYGPNSSTKYITTYFRKGITVANPQAYITMQLSVVRDDGIVVYINGTEAYRNNMPTGTIAYNTLSPVAIGGTDESAWNTVSLSPSLLVAGSNIIAVEIHQQALTSSDISFKARLTASGSAPLPVVTRGAYLQKLTPNSITVRWRTDVASNSRVTYGTTQQYGSVANDAAITTEHVVTLTGLTAGTRYYYTIGTDQAALQGDSKNTFLTAPISGTQDPIRVWVTGDFGNGSSQQAAVRNAYVNYTGTTATNLWIWLGDNAYTLGTDAEYQSNVFNQYPDQFKSFPLYPSPGNHDYAQSGYQSTASLGTNFPYFSIFTLPQAAEAGGMPSGTPKYYSYNYGNIHFISLDSYGAFNNASSPMYTWLNNDLANNSQRWTVVYFHHPPYSMGTHNSDTDVQLINMRTNIVPLLESYHVDLVLSGHSHVNERSYLIKGHLGQSHTFNSSMMISTATNNFIKSAPYDGTVYAICGTSGQNPGTAQAGWPMPCMYFSNNTNNCSMVLDVSGSMLTARYLTSAGAIVDQFSITKSGLRVAAPFETGPVEIFRDDMSHELVFQFELEEEANVVVEIYSITGQLLAKPAALSNRLTAGYHRLYIDDASIGLPVGICIGKIMIDGKPYVKKIFIR